MAMPSCRDARDPRVRCAARPRERASSIGRATPTGHDPVRSFTITSYVALGFAFSLLRLTPIDIRADTRAGVAVWSRALRPTPRQRPDRDLPAEDSPWCMDTHSTHDARTTHISHTTHTRKRGLSVCKSCRCCFTPLFVHRYPTTPPHSSSLSHTRHPVRSRQAMRACGATLTARGWPAQRGLSRRAGPRRGGGRWRRSRRGGIR